ncbi:MAG: RecX family transcriptional regulator [Acidobacteria bacterium]|nr:RecX family transcriptional regulator [Acidobacteriota bacterium]
MAARRSLPLPGPRQALCEPDPPLVTTSPYAAALALLAGRELSVAQLTERLVTKGYEPDEAMAAVARLKIEGAVDDQRAAAMIARRAATIAHRGPHRARREIEAAGIASDVARAAVDQAYSEAGDAVVLERALDRRLRGPVRDRKHFERLCRYLIRQGFDSGAAIAAVRARVGPDDPDADADVDAAS